MRVYGQALAQIADAEVKLFHLFVHEPLMRDGVPGLEIAEQMEGLAAEMLPLASPIMDRLHHRALQHFVGQDVVGHLELEGAGDGSAGCASAMRSPGRCAGGSPARPPAWWWCAGWNVSAVRAGGRSGA